MSIPLKCDNISVCFPISFGLSFYFWLPWHLLCLGIYYASPSSGEAYWDRQLTTNFELIFFCVPTCFHMRVPKPCLSVRPSVHLSVPREKKLPWLCQYQSYISNWYINGKVFTSTTPWKPQNLKKKVWNSNFDLWRRAEITLVSSISVLY